MRSELIVSGKRHSRAQAIFESAARGGESLDHCREMSGGEFRSDLLLLTALVLRTAATAAVTRGVIVWHRRHSNRLLVGPCVGGTGGGLVGASATRPGQ